MLQKVFDIQIHTIVVKLLDQNDKPVRVKGGPYQAHVHAPTYAYPRIVFPTYPNLSMQGGRRVKDEKGERQK